MSVDEGVEFNITNEEVSFEFSIYEYSTYTGGCIGYTASCDSPFGLAHVQ